MTGIYSVPGAPLRSQQHKQTHPKHMHTDTLLEPIFLLPFYYILNICGPKKRSVKQQDESKRLWQQGRVRRIVRRIVRKKEREREREAKERGRPERFGCLLGGAKPRT